MFWSLVFPVKDPEAGEPDVELRPLAPWESNYNCRDYPYLWVAHLGVWVLAVL